MFQCCLVCSQEKSKLSQLVMFEAAKRYAMSLEESVRGTEWYKLIEALSTAIEETELSYCTQARAFEPGTLRLEVVSQPGYQACEAHNWLAQHGGIEGEYEMSTILMVQDERVRSVILSMQRKWLHEQHVPEEEVTMD